MNVNTHGSHICARCSHAQWRFPNFSIVYHSWNNFAVNECVCCCVACAFIRYWQYRELIESIEWVKNAFDNISHTVEPMKKKLSIVYALILYPKKQSHHLSGEASIKIKNSHKIISLTQLTDDYEFDWERERRWQEWKRKESNGKKCMWKRSN